LLCANEEKEKLMPLHPYSRKKNKYKEESEHLISCKTNAAKKRYSKTKGKPMLHVMKEK